MGDHPYMSDSSTIPSPPITSSKSSSSSSLRKSTRKVLDTSPLLQYFTCYNDEIKSIIMDDTKFRTIMIENRRIHGGITNSSVHEGLLINLLQLQQQNDEHGQDYYYNKKIIKKIKKKLLCNNNKQ